MDILERLEAFWKRLDAEGAYTDGNIAWIAWGEITQLRAALTKCADELEHQIRAEYENKYGGHPAMDRRLERDLIEVKEARDVLKGTYPRSSPQ